MIKKKICMLGAFAVGKTSLVQRYVNSIFSDRYQTTVGVKIDKKTICIGTRKLDLILWDLNGEDEFQEVRVSYLRGASGCLYVIDGTRTATVTTVLKLEKRVIENLGNIPSVFALNKIDLSDQGEIDTQLIAQLEDNRGEFVRTSAKTGQGVETVFQRLVQQIMAEH